MNKNATSRLQALQERKNELDAALRAEREKRKEIERKAEARLIRIIGRALLTAASKSPDFELMLKGILRTSPLVESDRTFLAERTWL